MNSNWLNRIRQHTATPPGGAWEDIAGYLDDEGTAPVGFAAKLSALEIPAPATVQKNIFSILDAVEEEEFAMRVSLYEETAPAEVWPGIVTELDKKEASIIPLEADKKKTVYLRVAAAAVLVTLISVAAWLLSSRNTDGIHETATITPAKQPSTIPVSAEKGINSPAPGIKETKNNTAGNTTIEETKSAVPFPPAYIQNSETPALAQNPVNGKKDKLQTITGEIPEDLSLVNAPNSYINISGPDGQSVRVSSKFSNLISYLMDKNPEVQENLDIIIKESAQWRATFAKWRDKMTNSAVAPSLSNFMDIIELSSILEEKK